MATTVPDCDIDRFLSAALPGASRVPTRSGRNGYFSADATGCTCPQTGHCCSARATASLGERKFSSRKVFRRPRRRGQAAVMARGNIGGGYANPSSIALAARKSAVPKPSVKRA